VEGFDFYGFHLAGEFPFYGIPPILFAFSTGVSISIWRERHDHRYLLSRVGLLLLSGFILAFYVDGRFDAWGLFEMIALSNFILFFVNSKLGSFLGILLILAVNHQIPPFYSFVSEPVDYFFEFRALPMMASNAFVSGFFPMIPFITWAFWGVLYSKMQDKRLSLIPLAAGLALSFFEPFVYSQYGNVYSTSMILTTMGLSSLLLEALRNIHVPLLNIYGRYAWRMTFWRYFTLYMPFVWVGKFRAFNNINAFISAITLSISQIILVVFSNEGISPNKVKSKNV